MVLVDKIGLILIHIPKTGGASIENALGFNASVRTCLRSLWNVNGRRALHHYTWSEIKKVAPKRFDTYKKFSICRNPYDRFLSEYYFTPIPKLGYKHKQTMDQFIGSVQKIIEQRTYYNTPYHDHFMPQNEFIFDGNGKLMVDFLFRFEKLELAHKFLEQYGVIVLKNITHDSIDPKLRTPLTKAQKELIYKLYEKDFKLLNYPK